jgi:hypothetical protein
MSRRLSLPTLLSVIYLGASATTPRLFLCTVEPVCGDMPAWRLAGSGCCDADAVLRALTRVSCDLQLLPALVCLPRRAEACLSCH